MALFRHERRRYPRVNDILRISYQIGNDDLRYNCSSRDISEGGIRLNLYENIKTGTAIKLGIHLEDVAQPCWTIARIVWIKGTPGRDYPFEAGIEFSVLAPDFRASIHNHIQSITNKRSGFAE
ncbi:MAG: hypothetical protein A3K83_04795 [Omnitrophica WOR_2 bacterium RBG_13_44_8b]|nr:MAG: hypothetical protein A3K83_04795 [Omnitrophica WOR_2 bacterium RBG_13_44_8b]